MSEKNSRREHSPRSEGSRGGGSWGEGRRGNRERSERNENGNRGARPNGGRRHAQRGGSGRGGDRFHAGPQRATFREERNATLSQAPDLPGDIDIKDLDPSVLQDLRSLSKENAETVAKHLIMAATLLADDPKLALRHARAAKDRGGRVSVVRETAGIAAYHAGEWKEALSELRAARRMSGGPGLIAVMVDCERALGRPEKAIELAREVDDKELDEDTRIELAIVTAGARHDLNQHEAALAELGKLHPTAGQTGMSAARLMYAYADAHLALGQKAEAKEWFTNAKRADEDGFLDTDERLKELS